jgi:hypothetical protein
VTVTPFRVQEKSYKEMNDYAKGARLQLLEDDVAGSAVDPNAHAGEGRKEMRQVASWKIFTTKWAVSSRWWQDRTLPHWSP